jgi:hypothetical protein
MTPALSAKITPNTHHDASQSSRFVMPKTARTSMAMGEARVNPKKLNPMALITSPIRGS